MATQKVTVKGGRVRVKCKCNKYFYPRIRIGLQRQQFRCQHCGTRQWCWLNHRGKNREVCTGRADLEIEPGRTVPVHLCNISSTGIAFIVRSGRSSLPIGKKICIIYRNWGGRKSTRRIIVRNISKNRIGAEFVKKF